MNLDELITYLQRYRAEHPDEACLEVAVETAPGTHATEKILEPTLRNGWNTHLICVDGKAALFSDGPISK